MLYRPKWDLVSGHQLRLPIKISIYELYLSPKRVVNSTAIHFRLKLLGVTTDTSNLDISETCDYMHES